MPRAPLKDASAHPRKTMPHEDPEAPKVSKRLAFSSTDFGENGNSHSRPYHRHKYNAEASLLNILYRGICDLSIEQPKLLVVNRSWPTIRHVTRGKYHLSIVVPTYGEVENIALLTKRIFQATRSANLDAELILVDDNSQDGSEALVESLKPDYPVQMIVRTSERGLSTAVLRGFEEAGGDILLVMDADLSHPPEDIPNLYRLVENDEADFVFGSRYASGGETRNWPFLRKLNSKIATMLARPLTAATDPMAGFFCLSRETFERAATLSPLGYKIGLELMIKGRCRRLKEVPIVFADRHAGQSKLTLKQQVLYLIHLKRLYFFKYPVQSALAIYILPLLAVGGLIWIL